MFGRVRRFAGLLVLASVILAPMLAASAWEVDQTATVTSVIDGDTFDSSPTGRIRLADVDAPEYYEAGYQEAKDFLSGLIGGQTVYLDVDDVYGTDPYGRVVAVVYVRHNATYLQNVNQALLDASVAVVDNYPNEFDPATWASYVFYPVDAPPPTVTASANLTDGFAPLTVTFSSTASGGTPPYSFRWDFRDGGVSSLENPSHTFGVGGTFSVTLTVTDAARRSTTETIPITVHAALSVAVSVDHGSGTVPLTVTFSAPATGGSPPYSYWWDFGDVNTSTAPNPSHTYGSPGLYTVTATVTDAGDRTATDTVQITVSEALPPTPPLGGASRSPEGLAILVIGVVGVAVAVIVLLLRRGRTRR